MEPTSPFISHPFKLSSDTIYRNGHASKSQVETIVGISK